MGVNDSKDDEFEINSGSSLSDTNSDFWLSSTRAYFDVNLGLGDTSPGAKLHVVASTGTGAILRSNSGVGAVIRAHDESSNIMEAYGGPSGGNLRLKIENDGEVFSDGGYFGTGADFAESIEVVGDRSLYEPGDVLVIDRDSWRAVSLSSRPYSTLVAGIYSTRPGFVGGRGPDGDEENKVPMAVVGIVPCKVSAENGPIQQGDLLVTSSTPGHAMKGTKTRRMLGAIVGKALDSLSSGTGVIEVLVTLQ